VQPLEQRWLATAIVTRIDELFAIDAEACRQALSLEDALPSNKHERFWMDIRKQVEGARSTALAASALAKACNYVLMLVGQAHALPGMSGTGVQ
jgi:hypothetical protein